MAMPGDGVQLRVQLLQPIALSTGDHFAIREGQNRRFRHRYESAVAEKVERPRASSSWAFGTMVPSYVGCY